MLEIALIFYIFSSISYTVYFYGQKQVHHKSGFCLLFAAFLCHLASIMASLVHTGYLPVYSFHGILSFVSFSVTSVFMIIRIMLHIRIMGAFAAFLSAVVLGVSIIVPGYQTNAPACHYNDIMLIIHVVTVFTGDAAFILAGGAGFLYILQENAIKAKKKGFFFKRLPSLELLDITGYSCVMLGFCFLTLGLAAGIVYEKITYGKFWSWTSKEIWSAATWFTYAAILHGRKASGWRGRHAAIMYMAGLAAVIFTFFAINFVMGWHEDYFRGFRQVLHS